jgi:hypothetical protein
MRGGERLATDKWKSSINDAGTGIRGSRKLLSSMFPPSASVPLVVYTTNYKLTFKLDHPIGAGHRSVGRFFENFEELEAPTGGWERTS